MDIKIKKQNRRDGTSGLLSLEASIALTIFILLMLFMSSFFVVFEARNEIAHVLLTTADSLSLDAFANELPKDKSVQSMLWDLFGKSDKTFTNSSKWYDSDQTAVENVVRERFYAYLAGGNDEETIKILDNLNVVDGFEGLDFSASKVEGDKLYLEVRYKVKYEFRAFGFDTISLSQSCCSKIWK